MNIKKIAIGALIAASEIAFGFICYKKGFERGYQNCAQIMSQQQYTKIDKYVSKPVQKKNEESNVVEAETAPVVSDETLEQLGYKQEVIKEPTFDEDGEFDGMEEPETDEEVEENLRNEINNEIAKNPIHVIEYGRKDFYTDELGYSEENFCMYPEDPNWYDHIISLSTDPGADDYVDNEDGAAEIEGTFGYSREELLNMINSQENETNPMYTLYVVNHPNMCVYTIEAFGGSRGKGYEDFNSVEFPELV